MRSARRQLKVTLNKSISYLGEPHCYVTVYENSRLNQRCIKCIYRSTTPQTPYSMIAVASNTAASPSTSEEFANCGADANLSAIIWVRGFDDPELERRAVLIVRSTAFNV